MLPARPCERASVAPGARRGITHSEAIEILVKRDLHLEYMEALVLRLIDVRTEFWLGESGWFSAEATSLADGKNDLQTGLHWPELSGASEL